MRVSSVRGLHGQVEIKVGSRGCQRVSMIWPTPNFVGIWRILSIILPATQTTNLVRCRLTEHRETTAGTSKPDTVGWHSCSLSVCQCAVGVEVFSTGKEFRFQLRILGTNL